MSKILSMFICVVSGRLQKLLSGIQWSMTEKNMIRDFIPYIQALKRLNCIISSNSLYIAFCTIQSFRHLLSVLDHVIKRWLLCIYFCGHLYNIWHSSLFNFWEILFSLCFSRKQKLICNNNYNPLWIMEVYNIF